MLDNYAAYWAALLARHRAYVAASLISPVGVVRVVVGKPNQKEEQARDDDE